MHVALREALANVLVQADYTKRASVLVVKRPDMFGFRTPGLMRIPVEVALHGGEPDCRNRNLHKMFRFVGVGEQAGSEGTVNHARLCTVASAQPVELTRTLQHLTQLGMLDSLGSGRGAVYFLPGQDMPTPDDVFGPVPLPGAARSSAIGPSPSVLPASSSVLDDSSSVLDEASMPNAGQERDEHG